MRSLSWGIALTALACAAHAAAQTASAESMGTPPSVCEDVTHHQFDFWLGGWDVYPVGSSKAVAHSVIEPVYGGCGVRENWMPFNGTSGGSLNNYDTPSGKWHQSWIDSSGARVEYEGGLVDGRMVLIGTHKSGPNAGKGLSLRITLTPQPSGWVRQFGEQSGDGGQSWQPQYDFIYKPAQ